MSSEIIKRKGVVLRRRRHEGHGKSRVDQQLLNNEQLTECSLLMIYMPYSLESVLGDLKEGRGMGYGETKAILTL